MLDELRSPERFIDRVVFSIPLPGHVNRPERDAIAAWGLAIVSNHSASGRPWVCLSMNPSKMLRSHNVILATALELRGMAGEAHAHLERTLRLPVSTTWHLKSLEVGTNLLRTNPSGFQEAVLPQLLSRLSRTHRYQRYISEGQTVVIPVQKSVDFRIYDKEAETLVSWENISKEAVRLSKHLVRLEFVVRDRALKRLLGRTNLEIGRTESWPDLNLVRERWLAPLVEFLEESEVQPKQTELDSFRSLRRKLSRNQALEAFALRHLVAEVGEQAAASILNLSARDVMYLQSPQKKAETSSF